MSVGKVVTRVIIFGGVGVLAGAFYDTYKRVKSEMHGHDTDAFKGEEEEPESTEEKPMATEEPVIGTEEDDRVILDLSKLKNEREEKYAETKGQGRTNYRTLAEVVADKQREHEELKRTVPGYTSDSYIQRIIDLGHELQDFEGLDYEELSILKFEPGSHEAANQYRAMKLAEIDDAANWNTLARLFEREFTGLDIDETILMHIKEEREAFFGEVNPELPGDATWAEFFLYWGELLEQDFGSPIDECITELLENCGLDDQIADALVDDILSDILNRRLETPRGRGIFAIQEDTEHYENLDFQHQYWSYHGFLE